MKTLTLKFEGVDDVVLKRPTYREMREVGETIETLYQAATPSAVIYSSEFDKVLRAIALTDDDYDRIMELDHSAVWELWNKFLEFGRFDDFFSDASSAQEARQAKMMEWQAESMRRQMQLMQKSGLAPKDFSLEDVLTRLMMKRLQGQGQSESGESEPSDMAALMMSKQPTSTTTTPPSTAGRQGRSKK